MQYGYFNFFFFFISKFINTTIENDLRGKEDYVAEIEPGEIKQALTSKANRKALGPRNISINGVDCNYF